MLSTDVKGEEKSQGFIMQKLITIVGYYRLFCFSITIIFKKIMK